LEDPVSKGQKRPVSVFPEIGPIDEVRMYRGEKILSIAKRIAERGLDPRLSAPLALDVFYTYYLPVPLVEGQGESDDEDMAFRRAVISAMVRSENVWRAKAYTTADSLTSVVAAASFIERLSRLLPPSEGGQQGRESREQEEQGKGPEDGLRQASPAWRRRPRGLPRPQ